MKWIITGLGGTLAPHLARAAAATGVDVVGWDRTTVDPDDRRRTLVAPLPEHRNRAALAEHELEPIDDIVVAALVERLGPLGADHLAEATAALELLERLFCSTITETPLPCTPGDPSC